MYQQQKKGTARALLEVNHKKPYEIIQNRQKGSGTKKRKTLLDIISKSLQKIKKAAILFDVKVLDHLILIPNGEFYSFSDNGLI